MITRRSYDPKTGELQDEQTTSSDRLLELLLKARRPVKYRERLDVNSDVRLVSVSYSAEQVAGLSKAAAAAPEAFEAVARAMAEGEDAARPPEEDMMRSPELLVGSPHELRD